MTWFRGMYVSLEVAPGQAYSLQTDDGRRIGSALVFEPAAVLRRALAEKFAGTPDFESDLRAAELQLRRLPEPHTTSVKWGFD